ncbi:MAG: hypothetical protein SPI49_03475 [Eubacteriales bacterium]|nr:hypothetical protein [Eubacteriales bacterium]
MNDFTTIAIENTRFIFGTNFAGDAGNDNFGDARRKGNVIIPNQEQAKELLKAGFNVRSTKPRKDDDPEDFVPEYYITALLKYRTRNGNPVSYPPKVYLVTGDNEPVLLDETTVECIDKIRVKNVNVILNPYEYDPEKKKYTMYIRTMYVEQDMSDDPYSERYRKDR